MAFLNAVRWVKHVRGTQQINDSHPHALAYEIDSHELENASHFAMRISLFSSLVCGFQDGGRDQGGRRVKLKLKV